jgi:uncharacterized protein (TIGR03435 family)
MLPAQFLFEVRGALRTKEKPRGPQAGAPTSETPDSGASLFTAVQEQLGLKLEPHRTEVDFLVVDSVQSPSKDE